MPEREVTFLVGLGMMLIFAFVLLWIARRGDRLDREHKHPRPPTR